MRQFRLFFKGAFEMQFLSRRRNRIYKTVMSNHFNSSIVALFKMCVCLFVFSIRNTFILIESDGYISSLRTSSRGVLGE